MHIQILKAYISNDLEVRICFGKLSYTNIDIKGVGEDTKIVLQNELKLKKYLI